MAVDDHGLEVLKKSGEEVTPGDKSDYYIKVGPTPGLPLDISGTFTAEAQPSGLSTALKTSVHTVTDTAAAIPATPLANRNSAAFRNMGPYTIYFGSSAGVTDADGWPKYPGEEFHIDIKDDTAVTLYAVCSSGESSEVRILEVG